MNRSTRLEPFARIADQRQQGAARSLQESQAELERFRQRLQDLSGYRAEYAERLEKTCKAGSCADNIKRLLGFIAQLDHGIHELRSLIAMAEHRCDQRRSEWLATRARSRALDEVITRARSEEERGRLRREQRDTDERAQRGGPAGPDVRTARRE
jgi:flagellar FliJ protein